MTLKGSRGWTAAAALVAGMGIVFLSAPAEAKDEFEDGFKSELGRIAAHRAVYAGGQILGAVIYGDSRPHASRRGEYDRHHRYDDDARHRHRHRYRHHEHRRHDDHRHHWSRVQYRKHHYKHRHSRHGRKHKHHYGRGWHGHGHARCDRHCNVRHVEKHIYVYDD